MDGLPVATVLRTTLTPAEMQRDVSIELEPYRAHRTVVYSTDGAWNEIAFAGLVAFVVSTLLIVIGSQVFGSKDRWPTNMRAGLFGGVLAVLVMGGVWASLDTVQVTRSRHAFIKGVQLRSLWVSRSS